MKSNQFSLSKSNNFFLTIFLFSIFVLTLFAAEIIFGAAPLYKIKESSLIVDLLKYSRVPQALTALLCGGGIAISGLLLQCWFANPLAESSLLGISATSSLGVAFASMGISLLPFAVSAKTIFFVELFASPLGALLAATLLFLLCAKNASATKVLIFGILISYFASSIVALLMEFSEKDQIKNYLSWSFGTFSKTTPKTLPVLFAILSTSVLFSASFAHKLNMMLLGKEFAISNGINYKRFTIILLLVVSIISGTTTYFCGPISFIGIAAPHFSRKVLNSSDHKKLFPLTFLFGCALALFADLVSRTIYISPLPLNSILALIGVPVLFSILLKKENYKNENSQIESSSKKIEIPKIEAHSLKIEKIVCSYSKEKIVCKAENLTFSSGKIYALIGENGSGKTTFLKSLAKIIASDSEKFFLQTDNSTFNINELSQKEKAKKIGFVFSSRLNCELLSCYEVVALSRYRFLNFSNALKIKLSESEKNIIEAALELCSLSNLKNRKANSLSDGEFKRLMVATAIAAQPKVMIFDEPLAFLDSENKKLILSIFEQLRTCGHTIIFSSNDERLSPLAQLNFLKIENGVVAQS